MTSSVLMAFFDLPWTPIFLFGIAIFHPWLGMLAVAGGFVLIIVAVLNQIMTREPLGQLSQAVFRSERMGLQIRTEAEMIRSLGMSEASFARWEEARNSASDHEIKSSDLRGTFTATTKTFRLFLQSAMLG